MVDHWSKGWPYTPYILMRQSSGQNMHGQWLRDPVTFMPRRCQRSERKLALHRFLHTLLAKKSNNFSERLLYSWLSKNLFLCVSEGGAGGGAEGGGGLLHMNINPDSTSIIITGHKIVASFFLRRYLLSDSILGAIFMHTSIFSAWGEGAVEYFECGVYPRVTNTYMYMCQRYPVYTHVREFLATKGITIGVLLCQDKGVGSRMPIIGPVDWHKQILITLAVLIFFSMPNICAIWFSMYLPDMSCLVYNIGCWI